MIDHELEAAATAAAQGGYGTAMRRIPAKHTLPDTSSPYINAKDDGKRDGKKGGEEDGAEGNEGGDEDVTAIESDETKDGNEAQDESPRSG